MNEANEKRFNELIDIHGQDIVCAIVDRMMKVRETGVRDELLEKILFPISLCDEIPGVLPMNGPVGQAFHMSFKI